MDPLLVFEKFGLPVAFLIVIIWFYMQAEARAEKQRTDHREERREWRESSDEQHKETREALKELTEWIKRS